MEQSSLAKTWCSHRGEEPRASIAQLTYLKWLQLPHITISQPVSGSTHYISVMAIPGDVKNLIEDMSQWSNSIKHKALAKTEWSLEWDGRAETPIPWELAESLVSDIMGPNDCLFSSCSIYQDERPAGKHIKHIKPQETKQPFILWN